MEAGFTRTQPYFEAVTETPSRTPTIHELSTIQLEQLIYHDLLTGLPNRRRFTDRVEQATARGRHARRLAAVMVADLNRFTMLNDSYGPRAGDAVLTEVGRRWSNVIREGDTVARLGNDEFGFLLTDLARAQDAVFVAEKLMAALRLPVGAGGKEIQVTMAMGIALFPTDAADGQGVLEHAYQSLARARSVGGNSYQFYTADMNSRVAEFVKLERKLSRALAWKQFHLHYQPYFCTRTGRTAGAEALMRWSDPDLGMVSPARFIPVLEETGMIVEAGDWVLEEVGRQLTEWRAAGRWVAPMAVNLSAVQFRRGDLGERLEAWLRAFEVEPSGLVLEMTETTYMEHPEATARALAGLRRMGVKVSIDDFGTGYSSLAYLKKLPADHLKIDMSFVKDLPEDGESASIVEAIIRMAHSLKMETIAEGVETPGQLDFLRRAGCDYVQGYLCARPAPASHIGFEPLDNGL